MDIAICFWGLIRSGKWTHKNIQEQIDIMKTFGNVTIFMHTYKVYSKYSNKQGKEKNIMLDNDEYKLFNPDHFIWDNQDEIRKDLNLSEYHSQPDSHNTNYETTDNIVVAMYSLKRVTDLMVRHSKNKFTHVVFMRPDVLWEKPLKLSYFEVTNDTINTPQFHSIHHTDQKPFGIYVNDRFAICTPEVAKIYGRRFKYLLEYSRENILQSEIFLHDVLKSHGITIKQKWFCFNRVRANGNVLDDCKTKY